MAMLWRWLGGPHQRRLPHCPPPISGPPWRAKPIVGLETAGISPAQGDPVLLADAIEFSRRTTKNPTRLSWSFAYNTSGPKG
jgi:hypothetical protein